MVTPPPPRLANPIGDAARSKSLAATLAARPDLGPIHVFAYGSLLWDPCFAFEHQEAARLRGWVRRTCLWTLSARGSPEQPGLFYGLDAEPEGICDGAVFQLSEDELADGLDRLWRREMHAAVYTPRWLGVETARGPVSAIGFVVNRDHGLYAGQIGIRDAAEIIAQAHGGFGSCADYYRATVAALRALDLDDPALFALVDLVDDAASRRLAVK